MNSFPNTHTDNIHTHTYTFIFSSSSILFSPPAGDGFQVLSPPLYVVCMYVCVFSTIKDGCVVFFSSSFFYSGGNGMKKKKTRHTHKHFLRAGRAELLFGFGSEITACVLY